jgi:murein endopeptidase
MGSFPLTGRLAALTVVALTAAVLGALIARDEHTTASTGPTVSVPPPPAAAAPPSPAPEPLPPKRSRAIGKPYGGRLVGGIQLPAEDTEFLTWDPILKRSPNRAWRRWGTDRLLDVIAGILARYRELNPEAPRVMIGDLSRPHGGDFGPQYGAPGHASHQNGLDVDVYYPRTDGLERAPRSPGMVDRALAQDLADLFVAAGAEYVFVGPNVRLRGPHRIVQQLPLHDDHMHVRIRRR